MLYNAQCGCVVMITDSRSKDRREWRGRLFKSCTDDRPYQIGPERTLAEFFFSTEKMAPLSVQDTVKLYNELGQLISDGYRFRFLAQVLKLAVS